jgi:hypothetical protein
MNEEIQEKLNEWREYQKMAQKYTIAHEVKPGEPLHMSTEVELMMYDKWRTKADIALNEAHTLSAQQHPDRSPWSTEQLESEQQRLIQKLKFAEDWLKKHEK